MEHRSERSFQGSERLGVPSHYNGHTVPPLTEASPRLETTGRSSAGITVVLPVHNGVRWLERVLAAIYAARRTGPLEVVAIDDGSTDDSRAILSRHAQAGALTLLEGGHRGATAALNLGIRAARHALIAQIDQDVVIAPDWIERLVAAFDDPSVAAAQGHYVPAPDAGLWSRVMGLDLRQRYTSLGRWTDHVCTGNSIYRTSALLQVGLFDETLGYGYDNDMSYRLTHAGFRLAFCADAEATHYWREGLAPYFRQQYGFGYGRLDLLAKHRGRVAGDDVSPPAMMLHAPAMTIALGLFALAAALGVTGGPGRMLALIALGLVAALAVERFVAGARAALRFRDPAGWWFAPIHLLRDAAWATAVVTWAVRRARGAAPAPSDSMQPRDVGPRSRP